MRMMLLWALLLFFGGYAISVQVADSRAAKDAEAKAKAERLAVFTGLVAEHLKAGNVLADGVTPGSAIPRPSWYVLSDATKVATEGGVSYAFMEMPDTSTAVDIAVALGARLKDFGAVVGGRNAAGTLVPFADSSVAAIALPTVITDNAVVLRVDASSGSSAGAGGGSTEETAPTDPADPGVSPTDPVYDPTM